MPEICIRDLAEIVGGRLRLSEMPPLHGDWQPIRRIVFDSRAVQQGDVYWSLPSAEGQSSCDPAEAFLRLALGVVVAGRMLHPWAGAFCLQVEDAEQALVRLIGRLEMPRSTTPPTAFEKDVFLRLCCGEVGVITPPAIANDWQAI